VEMPAVEVGWCAEGGGEGEEGAFEGHGCYVGGGEVVGELLRWIGCEMAWIMPSLSPEDAACAQIFAGWLVKYAGSHFIHLSTSLVRSQCYQT
jgi:hypothetical protein